MRSEIGTVQLWTESQWCTWINNKASNGTGGRTNWNLPTNSIWWSLPESPQCSIWLCQIMSEKMSRTASSCKSIKSAILPKNQSLPGRQWNRDKKFISTNCHIFGDAFTMQFVLIWYLHLNSVGWRNIFANSAIQLRVIDVSAITETYSINAKP